MPVSLGRFSKNRTSGSSPPADAPIPTTKRGGTAVFSWSQLAVSPPSSALRVGLFVIAPSAGSRPPMDASEGKGHAHLVWIATPEAKALEYKNGTRTAVIWDGARSTATQTGRLAAHLMTWPVIQLGLGRCRRLGRRSVRKRRVRQRRPLTGTNGAVSRQTAGSGSTYRHIASSANNCWRLGVWRRNTYPSIHTSGTTAASPVPRGHSR